MESFTEGGLLIVGAFVFRIASCQHKSASQALNSEVNSKQAFCKQVQAKT